LGRNFGAYYYRKLAESDHACVFVCKVKKNKLAGITIGTTSLSAGSVFSLLDKIKLLSLANVRLFKPAFIQWVIKGVLGKIMKLEGPSYELDAEWLCVAVNQDYRGCGIAQTLIGKMEDFFAERGVDKYLIKTEKTNIISNKLFIKMGAELMATYTFHGRQINMFHKEIGH
jgi:ribosomal protein S18 acetylase RimI-like enzyme